jgi:hypothetical protein
MGIRLVKVETLVACRRIAVLIHLPQVLAKVAQAGIKAQGEQRAVSGAVIAVQDVEVLHLTDNESRGVASVNATIAVVVAYIKALSVVGGVGYADGNAGYKTHARLLRWNHKTFFLGLVPYQEMDSETEFCFVTVFTSY